MNVQLYCAFLNGSRFVNAISFKKTAQRYLSTKNIRLYILSSNTYTNFIEVYCIFFKAFNANNRQDSISITYFVEW